MYFVLQTPTLAHLAAVKIATQLWSNLDITNKIAHSFNHNRIYSLRHNSRELRLWMEIEYEVKSKVSALEIPQQCRIPLMNVIKPIGIEILQWCQYYYDSHDSCKIVDSLLLNHLYWTMHGILDYKTMAEALVKEERLDFDTRYTVACINCLEDAARELFQHVSVDQRKKYVHNRTCRWTNGFSHLTSYFTCALSGKANELHRHFKRFVSQGESLNKCLFRYTLNNGNRATCEYFYAKLTQEEKDDFLRVNAMQVFVECRTWPSCKELYCLKLLNEEQHERMYQKCEHILANLLSWPLQSIFRELVHCGWKFICRKDVYYFYMFNVITSKIANNYQDYDYCQLFWDCWRLTPDDCKQRYLANRTARDYLQNTGKKEFTKLVFK